MSLFHISSYMQHTLITYGLMSPLRCVLCNVYIFEIDSEDECVSVCGWVHACVCLVWANSKHIFSVVKITLILCSIIIVSLVEFARLQADLDVRLSASDQDVQHTVTNYDVTPVSRKLVLMSQGFLHTWIHTHILYM